MAKVPLFANGKPLISYGVIPRVPMFIDASGDPCDCCCLTCAQFWERLAGVDLSFSGGRNYTYDGCSDPERLFDSSTDQCLGTGLNTSLTLGPGDVEGDIKIEFSDCAGPVLFRSTSCGDNELSDCMAEEYLTGLYGGISCDGSADLLVTLGSYFTQSRITGTECDGVTFPCCNELGFTLGECNTVGTLDFPVNGQGGVNCIRHGAVGNLLGCCSYGPCTPFGGIGDNCDDPFGDPCTPGDVGSYSILLGE